MLVTAIVIPFGSASCPNTALWITLHEKSWSIKLCDFEGDVIGPHLHVRFPGPSHLAHEMFSWSYIRSSLHGHGGQLTNAGELKQQITVAVITVTLEVG